MKLEFTLFGIMVFVVILLGITTVYAENVQPEQADFTYREAMDNKIADLEEIAAKRETVIEELVHMWFMDVSDWETEFRSLLNLANDSKLLSILNAKSYNEVQAILGGGTPDCYSADRMVDPFEFGDPGEDLVYTPVNPCRIVDTRKTGGNIPAGGTRSFYVHGNGALMSAQGGNSAGCTSPRGEPRAVHVNIVAVNSAASGYLTVWPTGTGRPHSGILNYFPGRTDPISNAFTVKTGFALSQDINVYTHRTIDVVLDVMGYYYDGEPEKIVAAASTGTLLGSIGVSADIAIPTLIAKKTVTIPTNGRVILMGEASWDNSGSQYVGCYFFENFVEVDSWRWDAGDSDNEVDQHQTRFFLKIVTPGTKTYELMCYRQAPGTAVAYNRNLTIQFIKEGM